MHPYSFARDRLCEESEMKNIEMHFSDIKRRIVSYFILLYRKSYIVYKL